MNKKRALSGRRHAKNLLGDFMLEDVHAYRLDRHTFTVYVGGDPWHAQDAASVAEVGEPGVEFAMADRFEMNLNILGGIDSTRPILVILASCGGDWIAGMQMFGAILTCPNPVTVLATKWARSMTSIIPLAADRFALRPPAKYMFHRGSYTFSGTGLEAETDAIEYRKAHELMVSIYAARPKEQGRFARWSEQKIRAMIDQKMNNESDVWIDTDEAASWGFADAVFDGNYATLRATNVNTARRERMLQVLRKPTHVKFVVS